LQQKIPLRTKKDSENGEIIEKEKRSQTELQRARSNCKEPDQIVNSDEVENHLHLLLLSHTRIVIWIWICRRMGSFLEEGNLTPKCMPSRSAAVAPLLRREEPTDIAS
jgi:hypothetical protein